MKRLIHAFKPFFAEIMHDYMLTACLAGPILMGILFRFGLPMLERVLCEEFHATQILAEYYIVFDLVLAVMTPILFCFAGVLVILEEFDCGTAKYLEVTPIGKSGYLISRIGIPSLLAFVYDIVILAFFTASGISLFMNILLCVNGTLLALVTSLFVAAFAKNKIEGMALVKLCGLLVIGIPVAYFVVSPVRYIFGILPSFWMAELCITNNSVCFLLAVLSSIFMIWGLYNKFTKKLI